MAEGRAPVVREIRAAAPLLAGLTAPTTARGPWLTAALGAAPAPRVRHRAVVVEHHRQGRPAGLALVTSRRELRRGLPTTVVRLLGEGGPPGPPGPAPRRLPAASPEVAELLADGLVDLLAAVRGPWELSLTGLPMGDPVLRALSARLGTGSRFRTVRARGLVDHLDDLGEVTRSTDPVALERWLPVFLDHRPAGARLVDLRALARVHAATGVLEHAVVRSAGRPVGGLLTLLEGPVRLPWWGFGDVVAGTAPGPPHVSLGAASWTVSP
ncbi:hypothetical protein SAMN03159343_2646 [Klenkia marina]|uniref:BioF2-like acetyltransferase domain-containing protein n=1 Tax=Klenkia marina TaxID=1960309 RepID=A0A1G4YE75_9ACTN|nr:hypothetical protein SAMN03159343_2646 [Klenkia marina]